jgi:hypothetical protein
MGEPFRVRRIPADEVRRVVRRAADLAERSPHEGESLTEHELATRLGDLGFPAHAVKQAIASPATGQIIVERGVRRIVELCEIDGEVPAAAHESVAEAIGATMGEAGRTQVVGKKLVWSAARRNTDLSVTVHSRDGRTRVRVEESLGAKWQSLIGGGTFAVLASLMGGAIAADASGSKSLIIAMALAFGVGVFFSFGRLVQRHGASRSRTLEHALGQVVTAVRASIAPGVRIEQSTEATDDDAADAQAEEEASAGEPQRARLV